MRWEFILDHIAKSTGRPFVVDRQQVMAGGSINNAFSLTAHSGEQYFVKTNQTGKKTMFEAEARGLREMASTALIRVPDPVCCGDDGTQSYIVLEFLDMVGQANQAQLGKQLAAMHRVEATRFGWDIDNTIGSTHQPNTKMDNWPDFWREHRLGFQLALAARNGYAGKLQSLGEKLLIAMPALFAGREIKPSMLHGDLWGGNVAGLKDGTPVIYDPAFYYGDREADLSMTYLFGGFAPDFYAGYQDAYPLDEGFSVRKTFYNLYHIINHLNMFGGGYHGQAISMLEQVLAELS